MVKDDSTINHDLYLANEIASQAEIETQETYLDNIDKYKKKGYSNIPLPFEGKYYDLEADRIDRLNEEQIQHFDTPMIDVLPILERNPFVLLKPMYRGCKIHKSPPNNPVHNFYEITTTEGPRWIELVPGPDKRMNWEKGVLDLYRKYPESKEQIFDIYSRRFHIVTPSDLNRRKFRAFVYNMICELEIAISDVIEVEYETSEQLYEKVDDRVIERWGKERKNRPVHISEFLNLSDLIEIIISSQKLLLRCGFESTEEFEKQVRHLVDLRHRVMHSNRTVIHDNNMENIATQVRKLEETIVRIQNNQ